MKKLIILLFLQQLLILLIFLLLPLSASAESRWWDSSEVASFNAATAYPGRTGTTYYVDDATGDDGDDGLSFANAKKTIFVNDNAGDTILIGAGTYYAFPSLHKHGTAGNEIVIGPYGNGEVIIDKSIQGLSWVQSSGDLYYAVNATSMTAVVVDEVPCAKEISSAAVGAGEYYWDYANNKLYLWVVGGGDPTSHDIVVVPTNPTSSIFAAINMDGSEYMVIYGLTVRGSGNAGIWVHGPNNTVDHCNTKFNLKHGISAWGDIWYLSTNTLINKCNVTNNALHNWPRGKFNAAGGGWSAGISVNCSSSTITGCVVSRNHGEGLVVWNNTVGGIATVRDNKVYDNWSVNIYVDNFPYVTIDRNLSYCTGIDTTDLYNNGQDAEVAACTRRLRPEGIMIADESETQANAQTTNTTITNNIIIGCRRGINQYSDSTGSGIKNQVTANNTIIIPNVDPTLISDTFSGIGVGYNGGNNLNSIYKNNIVYGTNANTYLVRSSTAPAFAKDPFYELTFSNNDFYHVNNATPFFWGNTASPVYNFTDWRDLGTVDQGVDSITTDPLLTDVTLTTAAGARILTGSPCLDTGTDLTSSGVTKDYDDNSRANPFDMGAWEGSIIKKYFYNGTFYGGTW